MADLAINQSHLIFVCGAIVKDKKVLVGRRSFDESHDPGKWTLPGGKVDHFTVGKKYIVEQTLEKEIFEEVGVKINLEKVKYIRSGSFIRSTGHTVVSLWFICPWKSGVAKAKDEMIDVAWITNNDISRYEWAGDKRVLGGSVKNIKMNKFEQFITDNFPNKDSFQELKDNIAYMTKKGKMSYDEEFAYRLGKELTGEGLEYCCAVIDLMPISDEEKAKKLALLYEAQACRTRITIEREEKKEDFLNTITNRLRGKT